MASTTIASPSMKQDRRFAVDEAGPHRRAFDSFDNPGKTISEVGAIAGEPHAVGLRRRMRKPSCLISWIQPGPVGGSFAGFGSRAGWLYVGRRSGTSGGFSRELYPSAHGLPRSVSGQIATRRFSAKPLILLARPKRFELLTPKFVVWCSCAGASRGAVMTNVDNLGARGRANNSANSLSFYDG